MIEKIAIGLFTMVNGIAGLLLIPIFAIIRSHIDPASINVFISYISSFFSIATTYVGWFINATLIMPDCITLFITISIARLVIPFLVKVIKTAVAWIGSII